MKKSKLGKRILSAILLVFMLTQVFALSVGAESPSQAPSPYQNEISTYGSGLAYQNGSTNEYVYSTVSSCNAQGGDYIGYLYPYETAVMIGYYSGLYIIMYETGSGDTKVGFVKYNGGNTDPYWNPQPFNNGAGRLPVYRSLSDAENGVNSIGSLDPYENCTAVFGTAPIVVVLYSTGSTAKVGFVKI